MGTPTGFEQLLEQSTPALFRRALLLCHDWHFAEDLVQETAVLVLKKWKLVKKAANKDAYLQALLTNLFLSKTRSRSYQEKPATVELPTTVDPWPEIELELRVAEGLATLTPDERAVVIARYMDDLPVAQVAQNLGRGESWVKVTTHRALQKLHVEFTGSVEPAAGVDPDCAFYVIQSLVKPWLAASHDI